MSEKIPYFVLKENFFFGAAWCRTWVLDTFFKLLVEFRVLPEVASWLLMVTVGDLSGKVGKITDSK